MIKIKKETFLEKGDFDYVKISNFFRRLNEETDRGAAIVGAAYLDNLLNELLKRRLIKDKELFEHINDRLNFNLRIILCYLTGLIRKNEKEDLDLIRDVRNYFAHDITINDFKKREISDKCNKISVVKEFKIGDVEIKTPKDKYNAAISRYWFILGTRLFDNKIRIKCLRPPPPETILKAGSGLKL